MQLLNRVHIRKYRTDFITSTFDYQYLSTMLPNLSIFHNAGMTVWAWEAKHEHLNSRQTEYKAYMSGTEQILTNAKATSLQASDNICTERSPSPWVWIHPKRSPFHPFWSRFHPVRIRTALSMPSSARATAAEADPRSNASNNTLFFWIPLFNTALRSWVLFILTENTEPNFTAINKRRQKNNRTVVCLRKKERRCLSQYGYRWHTHKWCKSHRKSQRQTIKQKSGTLETLLDSKSKIYVPWLHLHSMEFFGPNYNSSQAFKRCKRTHGFPGPNYNWNQDKQGDTLWIH